MRPASVIRYLLILAVTVGFGAGCDSRPEGDIPKVPEISKEKSDEYRKQMEGMMKSKGGQYKGPPGVNMK